MADEAPQPAAPAPRLSPVRESGGAFMPALYDALAMAQGVFPPIPKNRVGKIEGESSRNGKAYSFEYRYADLGDVFTAVRPSMSKHGLAILQITRIVDGAMIVVTRLTHRSGAWIESDYPVAMVSGGMKHQTVGGALTYAKRNAACALLGVVAEDDNDDAGEEREGMTENGEVDFVAPAKSQPPRRQAAAPRREAPRQEEAPREQPATTEAAAASAYADDPLFKTMMEPATSLDLTKWHGANASEIQKKSADADWRDEFYARYDHRQSELKGKR